ncbi:MAG TPA: STAS/SEC14 domain-containing protein [Actinomycetospora sp.]|uniref:STAS/SEC14 domain-containing protein n=1 Tax=Actinomycetospora sp. TaxID=1872135 RepID=UPI002F3E3E32
MLETIADVPDGVLALRATGTVTGQDFLEVVEPEVDRARDERRRVRVLLVLGADYEGFTTGAVLEKTELWLRTPGLGRWIEGYALVSDIRWVGELVHLAGWLMSFPMRTFGEDEFDDAVAWLCSLEPALTEATPTAT